jgi:hypothetical protein
MMFPASLPAQAIPDTSDPLPARFHTRALDGVFVRAAVLVLGLIAPQVLLYGPSLVGKKILLPLDLLAIRRFYLPATPEYRSIVPHDIVFTDQVLNYEYSRRFAASEFRAGRLPLWDPNTFAGAPFAHFGKYCPLYLIYYLFPSPVSLAWIQLVKSLIAGLGAYFFFRKALRVGFWPAAVGAWCYPLTGFFIFWQGYPIALVTEWFPWLLLATDGAVRRPFGGSLLGLAIATALTITAGHLDVSGQALLASGMYAMWAMIDEHGRKLLARPALVAASVTGVGWVLGIMLAAPYLLPLLDYARTGARMAERLRGSEERPPVGLSALPQMLLPDAYGSLRRGWVNFGSQNLPESGAASYTGLLATLLFAPLAWCSRRHRSAMICWLVLGVVGLAWMLNIPGLVQILRLPVLNMMSHNRFVFVTSFGILALAVIGLDLVARGNPGKRWWFLLAVIPPLFFGLWCLQRALFLPRSMQLDIINHVEAVRHNPTAPAILDAAEIQRNFRLVYAQGALLCGVAVAGWALVSSRRLVWPWLAPVAGILLVGELLWFAHDVNPQCDPALYYPPLPALVKVTESLPARSLGIDCLPANVAPTVGLRDIRGYDGIDPGTLVEVLKPITDGSYRSPSFAELQWFVPVFGKDYKMPGIVDMLNVRYLIFRGRPPHNVHPLISADDYWVLENNRALPRVFVPRQVRVANDKEIRLARLAADDFDPSAVAYVSEPLDLPKACRGTAKIIEETPTYSMIDAHMETPGLLVVSERWENGWNAYVDDRPAAVTQANDMLRAVSLPAGNSRVVFRYEPFPFAVGVKLMVIAALILLVATPLLLWSGRNRRTSTGGLIACPQP